MRGAISLKTFYIRRALRIWPVFYAFALFLFVVSRTTALGVSSCQFATALTFTKNFGCSSWIDGHLWSLSVEQQFYLFWPAVLVFFSLRASAGIAAAAILIAPLSRLFEARTGLPQWWLTSHADALMAGSLAAFALNFHHDLLERILYTQAARWRLVAFALLAAPVILRRYWPDDSLKIMLGPSVQAFAAVSATSFL